MAEYAMIFNNEINNVILVEDISKFLFPAGVEVVLNDDKKYAIGDKLVDGKWCRFINDEWIDIQTL